MNRKLKRMVGDEKGFVLVLSVLMLAVVTVIGFAATRTSDTELLTASNEKQYVNNFYKADGGLINEVEGFTTWLTTAFLTADETAASYSGATDIDSDGTADASAEVRCIENSGADVAGLSTAANDIPALSHTGPPPAGSGYSVMNFEVRRFALTATSSEGNTRVQAGVYKVFNKY